jgi:hypothetical protein
MRVTVLRARILAPFEFGWAAAPRKGSADARYSIGIRATAVVFDMGFGP